VQVGVARRGGFDLVGGVFTCCGGVTGADVEEMRELIRSHNAEAVVWEPEAYDAALVGVGHRCGSEAVAVYDYGKLVEVTMALSDGGSEEEAAEYVEFNILGAYVGESTPMVLMQP